jgi:hypothetical protein
VDIVATIMDSSPVGSRADCVLYVDGVAVDRATNIWVDGKDAVSCAFTTTFDTEGTQTVTVALENVPGGTMNMANTTAQMSLQVVAPATPTFTYDASVDDRFTDATSRLDYQWSKPDGSGKEYVSTASTAEHRENLSLVGSLNRATSFPLARLELSWTTAGVAWEDYALTGLVPTTDAQGRQCVDQLVEQQGSHLFVCSTGTGSSGVTAVGFTRFGGRATYHSWGYSTTWDGVSTPSTYTFNDGYAYYIDGGFPHTPGATVAFHFAMTDGAGTIGADPVITVAPYTEVVSDTGYNCERTTPDWLEGGSQNTCTSTTVTATGLRGSVSSR